MNQVAIPIANFSMRVKDPNHIAIGALILPSSLIRYVEIIRSTDVRLWMAGPVVKMSLECMCVTSDKADEMARFILENSEAESGQPVDKEGYDSELIQVDPFALQDEHLLLLESFEEILTLDDLDNLRMPKTTALCKRELETASPELQEIMRALLNDICTLNGEDELRELPPEFQTMGLQRKK